MFPPHAITAELDPLIVTAPSIRCGTTLLQRLISSAPNGLLFGELAANEMLTALQLAWVKLSMYAQNSWQFASTLETYRKGEINEWIIDLMPDLGGYTRALVDGYLAPLVYCREFAHSAARTVWGVKNPGWGADVLTLILNALPRAKVIFIHRDIVPVLRSAKARRTVRRLQEAKEFCTQWATNMAALPQLHTVSNVLVVDYDELARDAEAVLQRIESFAGLCAIDRGVLAHRINERDRYIEPAQLTNEETAVAEAARLSS
jgi:hypothetical protein